MVTLFKGSELLSIYPKAEKSVIDLHFGGKFTSSGTTAMDSMLGSSFSAKF